MGSPTSSRWTILRTLSIKLLTAEPRGGGPQTPSRKKAMIDAALVVATGHLGAPRTPHATPSIGHSSQGAQCQGMAVRAASRQLI